MTLEDALARLESLGNAKMRAQNRKRGADDNQFGVRHGDIRKLAATIKTDHARSPECLDLDVAQSYLLSSTIRSACEPIAGEIYGDGKVKEALGTSRGQ
jgi:hypothetical protein